MTAKRRPLTQDELEAAAAFRRALEQSNKSQDQIAAEIGVTQGAIWQWADGKVPISAKRALSAAKAVGARPEDISVAYRQALGLDASKQLSHANSSVSEVGEMSHPRRLDPGNVIVTVRTLQIVLGRRGVQLDLTNPIHAELFCEVYEEAVALPEDDPAAAAALGATVVELAQRMGGRKDDREADRKAGGVGRGGGERKRAS